MVQCYHAHASWDTCTQLRSIITVYGRVVSFAKQHYNYCHSPKVTTTLTMGLSCQGYSNENSPENSFDSIPSSASHLHKGDSKLSVELTKNGVNNLCDKPTIVAVRLS